MTVVSSTPSMVWLDPQPVDCHDDRVHCYFSTWIVHLKVFIGLCSIRLLYFPF